MADERITALAAETEVDAADVLHLVDVSDNTHHADGTSMKVTVSELLKGMISFFQVEDDGTTGQLTTGSAAVLSGMWGTASITDADFTWSGSTGLLTVKKAGIIELDVAVTSYNNANNRHELHVQIQKNSTTVIVESANYASRNNTQDEGNAIISGFKDVCAVDDTYRIRVFDIGVAATIGASNVAGMTYLSAKLYK